MNDKENKNKELNDKDLKETSGGFGRIRPNSLKIYNNPNDIFPKDQLNKILKNYKKK